VMRKACGQGCYQILQPWAALYFGNTPMFEVLTERNDHLTFDCISDTQRKIDKPLQNVTAHPKAEDDLLCHKGILQFYRFEASF